MKVDKRNKNYHQVIVIFPTPKTKTMYVTPSQFNPRITKFAQMLFSPPPSHAVFYGPINIKKFSKRSQKS